MLDAVLPKILIIDTPVHYGMPDLHPRVISGVLFKPRREVGQHGVPVHLSHGTGYNRRRSEGRREDLRKLALKVLFSPLI